MIPGPPLLLQNLCLSILDISEFKFFYTTFIGFIPYMAVFALIGAEMSNLIELHDFNLQQVFSTNFLILLTIIIILILLRIIYKKKRPSK